MWHDHVSPRRLDRVPDDRRRAFVAPVFQVGDRVRWRPEMSKASTWVGVVTCIDGRMAQCDNRGFISFGLLEKVGETMDLKHLNDLPTIAEVYPNGTPSQQMAELRAEIEGLQAVVIAQCEAMAGMVSATEHAEVTQDQFDAGYEQAQEEAKGDKERLAKLDENWKTLGDYVSDVLSEIMGTGNPVTLTTCPLPSVRALAEFVRDA